MKAPPGFNPFAYRVNSWFHSSLFNFNLYRYNAEAATAFLDTDELHDEVWSSYGDTIRGMGIHSIPLFIFNAHPEGGPFRKRVGRTLTHNGSGSPEEFLALFEKAWTAQKREAREQEVAL